MSKIVVTKLIWLHQDLYSFSIRTHLYSLEVLKGDYQFPAYPTSEYSNTFKGYAENMLIYISLQIVGWH